jgi:hypothetical protein
MIKLWCSNHNIIITIARDPWSTHPCILVYNYKQCMRGQCVHTVSNMTATQAVMPFWKCTYYTCWLILSAWTKISSGKIVNLSITIIGEGGYNLLLFTYMGAFAMRARACYRIYYIVNVINALGAYEQATPRGMVIKFNRMRSYMSIIGWWWVQVAVVYHGPGE